MVHNFEAEYKKLNKAQKGAVDAIEGPVLVIAGPGTGKTQLLSVRVANILKKTDTLPQNILCLTFTDSAAHTMRQRLANLIGQAAYDVTISTYHAFGSELIRRFPDYFSHDLPEARPIDDLGIDQTIRRILNTLPYSNPLRYADNYIRDIKTLISDFKRALLEPEDIAKVADSNEQFINKVNPWVQSILRDLKRIDKKSVDLFEQLAQQTRKFDSDKKVTDNVVPLSRLWQEQLEEALEDVASSGKTAPLTAWKNAWLVKDSHNQLIVNGMNAVRKMRAAAIIYQKYLSELDKNHLYDYDDMILRAIRGLEQNPDLKFTLQEQYLYILLDEFQDTNAAQLRLVELLTDNPVNEGRPNVLAVGDDDQAIYAFQGADYSHMLSFQQTYRDVLLVPLTENYRSHSEILDLTQGVAGQIKERLHHRFPGIQKDLAAKASDLPASPVIERHEFKSDLAQFAWIAGQIQKLVQSGVGPGEIAVLAPEHRYLEPLVPYLQQAGIALRYDKRENVLDDPRVSELIQMMRLVLALNRQDQGTADSLWPEILSYQFWGIATSDIWQLSWQAHTDNIPWTNLLISHPQLKPVALFFVKLSLLIHTENLEMLLDYLIGTEPLNNPKDSDKPYASPFYSYYFSEDKQQKDGANFWTLLSNLTVLRQHLREYQRYDDAPLTAQDFLTFVDAHREAEIKILNTSPYHEAADAVELMTAYKAKGREFISVFVLATIDEAWGTRARGGSSKVPLPPNLQFIRYAGASEDERLRLFYVALTRARSQLYLTSFTSNYANKLMSRLKFLSEIEEEGTLVSPLLPEKSQVVHQDDVSPPALPDLSAYWQQRHLEPSKVPLKELLTPRLERYQLAPTHLNAFTDVMFGGPRQFFINTLLNFPKAPSLEVHYGNAIHKTLENIHAYQLRQGKLPTTKQVLDIFETLVRALRLSDQQTLQLLERGRSALQAYLSRKTYSFSRNDKFEVNFRHEGVFVGDAHMTGTIDKLIIDKANKTVTIVDFKTGRSHQRWSGNDVRLHKYRQQLYMYKLLVEGSHSFAGYKVTGAYLDFVEPNEDGELIELALNFTEPEMEHIKKLIGKVLQHIKELNFPDVKAYNPSTKGILAFEEDLLEGKV